jgi:hypothetical protein
MDDDVIGDLTKEDLAKAGFVTGNAVKFLKAFAACSSAPSAAGGGGAVPSPLSSPPPSLPPASAVTIPSISDGDAYALFVAAYGGTLAPEYPDQLLAAVRETTFSFCRKLRVSETEAVRYFKQIQAEAFEHKDELLDSIAESAVLIWTSAKRLTLAPGSTVEFCSLLNRILREHDPDLLPLACVVVRGINLLCVMRHQESKLLYPPGGESHRGGGLPLQHVPFFVPGKKFRVPMFLATSFDVNVAFKCGARFDSPACAARPHAVAPGFGSWRSTPACPPCTGLFAWIPKGRSR